MHLVERSKSLLLASGSEWILWLLLGLSGASLAIIVERGIALRRLRGGADDLRVLLVDALRDGGFSKAREVIAGIHHPAARVALRGMRANETDTDTREAEGAMNAQALAERRSMEQRVSFLATLGTTAPFIGLLGTVIGVLQAFDALGGAASNAAPAMVMTGIAEALVATAVGLAVAIPAAVAFNALSRGIRGALDDAQLLSLEVLSHLDGARARAARPSVRIVPTAKGA